MTAAASGAQILTLTGLRFDASLGVLDHEKMAPQPIQVDAELSLGRRMCSTTGACARSSSTSARPST